MRFRYFLVDGNQQLVRVAEQRIEKACLKTHDLSDLVGLHGEDLRVVTVSIDDNFLPTRVFVFRARIINANLKTGMLEVQQAFGDTVGVFLPEDPDFTDRCPAHEGLLGPSSIRFQMAGWPQNLAQQLAIALDVPPMNLPRYIAFGGPLVLAAYRSISVATARQWMTDALKKSDPQ